MRAMLIAWGLFGAFLALAALIIFAPLALGGWQRFGPADLRWWLLVRGTTADRLGVFGPAAGSVRYAVRGQDGNSPTLLQIEFETTHPVASVVDHYAARCAGAGLVVERSSETMLVCTRPRLELAVHVAASGPISTVRVGGWEYGSN